MLVESTVLVNLMIYVMKDQISDRSNLREERLILSLGFRSANHMLQPRSRQVVSAGKRPGPEISSKGFVSCDFRTVGPCHSHFGKSQ